VALQVSDVLSGFRSCVLLCSQFSLNLLVQIPEGIGGDVLQIKVVIFGS
jgi:hypothetical protein